MRWQLAAAGVVALAVTAWFIFQPRSSAPDLLVARDRMVAGPGVVATFSPGGAEGYRFTVVRGEGWVWERTSGSDGSPLPDAIVYNGSQYLLRVQAGCYIALPAVQPPLVPGLTASKQLTRQPGLDEQASGLYAYDLDGSPFSRNTEPASVRVTEDLRPLRDGQPVVASTGDPPGAVWQGTYNLRPATGEETNSAREAIRQAKASDFAQLVIRERAIGSAVLFNATIGPYRIVIPEGCPDAPTLLASGANGGQLEGLRSAPSPISFARGVPALIANARETTLKVRAPEESFDAVVALGNFGSVPVTTSNMVVAASLGGGYIAVEIQSCTSRPWFQC
jgi:hypothetical protein